MLGVQSFRYHSRTLLTSYFTHHDLLPLLPTLPTLPTLVHSLRLLRSCAHYAYFATPHLYTRVSVTRGKTTLTDASSGCLFYIEIERTARETCVVPCKVPSTDREGSDVLGTRS